MANIARLKELLKNVVPYIPPRRLKMRDWTGRHRELPNGCGTTACIAGWAGVHPAFNKQGYHLASDEMVSHWPEYKRRTSVDAVMCFFDVTEFEFDHMFGETNLDDAVDAACRIINVIESNTD